ncbi:hypothetical protein ACQEU5_15710 [Marinactinospora thermotolerans]|uniref:Septum formation initiator n=1 Tax=Marinactinospora thermotolerans DSM 45154 TaxID=1122192 RepID=A0A1T4SQ53_9ACTN|nr:hypothetical protein [Marinactinospora thermotolerans]SKA30001.1 hypothetical protein SAMN02745673_03803 [Marinactinospora thermotolerans DSM 45154]
MKRQSLFAVGGWLAAAVVAVGVGITAVNLLGTGITSESAEPLSQASVEQRLEAEAAPGNGGPSTEPQPSPSETGGTADPPEGAQRNPDAPSNNRVEILESTAGTVAASCSGTTAVLEWWAPAQGHTVDDYDDGPAPQVWVEFEGTEDDVEMTIHCADGKPALAPQGDDDGDDDSDD